MSFGTIPAVSRPRLARAASFCVITALAVTVACARAAPDHAAGYRPRTRELTITTVPLLVKEAVTVYPFLKPAFAKGGVLDGKEVYAFSPSTITIVAGDTLHLTIFNPEDDVHSFVLPDLAVSLPAGKVTTATYVAKAAGIYPFTCAVASHLPMMQGQLVVLAATAVGNDAGTGGAVRAAF